MSAEKRKRHEQGTEGAANDVLSEENETQTSKRNNKKIGNENEDRIEAKKVVTRAYKDGWPNHVLPDVKHTSGDIGFRIAYRGSFDRAKNGREYESKDLLEWMIDLTETNMKTMYNQTWGWNETQKLRELRSEPIQTCFRIVNER
jgi:hypothetical protein